MITIKSVAKYANVSIGTVSNVLSGNRPVSDVIRKRVLNAIEELGYQPNMLAHSLVTGRSNIIGMVVPDYSIEGLIAGIDFEASKMGYSLLVSKLESYEDPDKQLHALVNRRVDGIIWCIPERDNSHEWTKNARYDPGIPIILAFCTPKPHFSTVWVDNYTGGYQAAKHLIQHGCRRIAHISGPLDFREARDRKAGFEDALKEAGLDPKRIIEGGWYIRDGWYGMQRLLEKWPDFDSVFVISDETAFGAINVMQRTGRRVPDDIKVIGFDDVIDLDYYNPPLTTIHQDYRALGASLAIELSRRLKDPSAEPEAQTLPTHLVIRESCGCHYAGAPRQAME